MKTFGHIIGKEEITASAETFQSIDPYTGDPRATFPLGGAPQAELAAAGAPSAKARGPRMGRAERRSDPALLRDLILAWMPTIKPPCARDLRKSGLSSGQRAARRTGCGPATLGTSASLCVW
jgi:aminomuconate-semialdehyde/2-hydroxymuconate-6-semialdehyde dehydrogenase